MSARESSPRDRGVRSNRAERGPLGGARCRTVRRICVTRAVKSRRTLVTGSSVAVARPGPLVAPLFSGTVYLADVHFSSSSGSRAVAPADLSVVQQYLELIASPISAYASQYGSNRLSVGPPLPRFVAAVHNSTYADADLQGWINTMRTANGLSKDSIILVINPPGMENLDAKESGGVGVLGYHGLASIPYCFVNALGSGFSLDDRADLFAEAVSHEVAEMTVDPGANDANPEVCDGCGSNCRGPEAYRAFFDEVGHYLGSGTVFPPPYSYAFFLSAIAKPPAATDCPAPPSACAYAPP